MKITSKCDVGASPDFVFARMSDYEAWERAIAKRNTTLVRSPGPIRPGTTWDTRFRLKGRDRDMLMTLFSEIPGRQVHVTLADTSLDVDILADLIEVAPERSRIAVSLELRPRNLTARLLIQSLRLAKGKVQGQLDQRVDQWARNVSQQYRTAATAKVG
ncbi:hypothetical protein [Falsirhodobacter sp. 1013]|uniref:hypothetical protein n=1 Tax=Falsirhodobacter sp. 1013 TaxID=3417566 RepID=UPI003EBE05B9